MKKTLTINLGGIVYHIDDDAYRLLDNYLSNLKHYFRKQEGAEEIVDDIEMRIAELFAEKVTEGKQVITVSDVEEIIARVGKPEDFGAYPDDFSGVCALLPDDYPLYYRMARYSGSPYRRRKVKYAWRSGNH